MRIAVCTDFSSRSRESFSAAASLAKLFSAELFLVHQAQPALLPQSGQMASYYESLEQKLSGLLSSEPAFSGLDATPLLVRGGNVRTLTGVLDERDVDLLCVATHGRTGVARFLLGSFAERLIRFARCPVLVCRTGPADEDNRPDFELRRILVAHDFSAQSRNAVDYARTWAEAAGAKVRVLHVIDSECGVTGFEIELFSNWHEFYEEKRRQALEHLKKLASTTLKNVDTEIDAVIGHPVLEILSQSESFDADLVAMGTHGGEQLERFLLGSVAEKVVRKAHQPVLVVR